VEQAWHPRAIFRFAAYSYIPLEQFWGRAARASWVRKNPDARLIFPQVVWRGHSCPRAVAFFASYLSPTLLSHASCISLRAFADRSVRATRAIRLIPPLNLWKW